jgi:hypothetical protein
LRLEKRQRYGLLQGFSKLLQPWTFSQNVTSAADPIRKTNINY